MFRYLGISPPPEKKKKTENKAQRTDYELNKRTRSFQTSWQAKFNWVRYDEENKNMFCKVCEAYDVQRSGSFVTGCSNFRLDSLIKHDISEGHKKCQSIDDAKHKPKESSKATKAICMLNQAASLKLDLLFRNAHAIAKMGRPYTDFVSLCVLDTAKGLDIGKTYINDKYCQKFIGAIADTIENKQSDILKEAQFLWIISDGSTDSSSTEAEIVYIKTSKNCRVYNFFAGLKNVSKGDAEHIVKGITEVLDGRFKDWREKIVAIGTDGASVMVGNRNGVVKRISELTDREFVRSIHCSAHRLELAFKDAVKESTLQQKCDLLLLNLYLFYRYSPLNRANLKNSFKALGQKPLVPTRVGGTRWLPHTVRALQQVLNGKEAIIQHLEQMQVNPSEFRKESSAKGRNFLKLLKDESVTLWLNFLMDVVKCLSRITLAVQDQHSTLGDIHNELECAKLTLKKHITSDGPVLRKVNGERDLIQIRRTAFLNRLVECISQRFAGDLRLFAATTVLAIDKWPIDSDALLDYGDEEICSLIELSRKPLESATLSKVDCDEIENEWTWLKNTLKERKQNMKDLSWETIHYTYASKVPNLLVMVDYFLCLPASSVDAERGFSRMKLVKNDWRSRLGDKNLSDLMLIAMEGQPIADFDPTDSINLWSSGGARTKRPFYMDELSKRNIALNEIKARADVPNTSCVANAADDNVKDDDAAEGADGVVDAVGMADVVLDATISDDNDSEDDESYYDTLDLIQLQRKSYRMLQELV